MSDTPQSEQMHCEPATNAIELGKVCEYCRRQFTPTRKWGRFCSVACRNYYDLDFGASGSVASVRKLKTGVSVVVHLPDGPAAERALKLEIKNLVRITRQ